MGVADPAGDDAHWESGISWRRMFAVFWRIGILSFGGPAAQIALMHRVLVEEEKWLDEPRFLGALSFCMLLPGPEAMQLATYAGWQLRGVPGGLLAGLLFVVPGALVVLGLAALYMTVGHLPVMAALFLGIKGAVLIIVLEALLRVSKRALHSAVHWIIAGLAFVAIFFLSVPYPVLILAAGLAGFFLLGGQSAEKTGTGRGGGSMSGALKTVVIWMVVWWTPVLLLMVLGGYDILVQIGNFFSRLAVVTFGGAYAVLAYLAQDVVTYKGWLSAGEMMDGLGLAETTPGPLILVTEFVGYIAAYRAGGVSMGIAGALVTLWVTFAPCFLWIFVGAPYETVKVLELHSLRNGARLRLQPAGRWPDTVFNQGGNNRITGRETPRRPISSGSRSGLRGIGVKFTRHSPPAAVFADNVPQMQLRPAHA